MWSKAELSRLRTISEAERRALAEAVAMIPLVRVSLWVMGFKRTRALVAGCASQVSDLAPGDVARLVSLAARRGPTSANCMVQSLTLQWLLRRRGFESELRIGVRKDDGKVAAHAWVEHAGHPLMQSPDVHVAYSAFGQLPRDATP